MTGVEMGQVDQRFSRSSASRKTNVIGVYTITCLANGTVYVGSSKNCDNRLCGHRSKLRGGQHLNKAMLSDFRQYSEWAFTFRVEQVHVTIEEALTAEKALIHSREKVGPVYNKVLRFRRSNEDFAALRVARLKQSSGASFRPIIAKWPTLTDFAKDVGITLNNAVAIRRRDSIPTRRLLAVAKAAEKRGFGTVTLNALVTIKGLQKGTLEREAGDLTGIAA
jgi:predicted GIY-YIG superfamily endonuclease